MPRHTFVLNGKQVTVEAPADMPLLWVLRDLLQVTGPKYGCGVGVCRACTSHLDGAEIQPCVVPVADCADRRVTTIEGLADGDVFHPVQQGFYDCHAFQCGFCTPGFVMTTVELLADDPTVDEAGIRDALSGNICRCTGYESIVEGVKLAASRMAGTAGDGPAPD